MEATTKDLRLHTRELIAATDRGEKIVITYRGKPRAMLTPITEQLQAGKRQTRNPAFGLWQESQQTESVDEQVRRLRQPRSHT